MLAISGQHGIEAHPRVYCHLHKEYSGPPEGSTFPKVLPLTLWLSNQSQDTEWVDVEAALLQASHQSFAPREYNEAKPSSRWKHSHQYIAFADGKMENPKRRFPLHCLSATVPNKNFHYEHSQHILDGWPRRFNAA